MTTDEDDVAVVGGGLSGLASAVLLARRGRCVTVYEGSPRLGGRAQSPLLGGVPVNLGPHALYLGGDAAELLHELGVPTDGGPPPTDGGWVFVDGAFEPLPSTPWALWSTTLLNWRERFELTKLLLPLMSGRVRARPDESLASWLDERVSSTAVRALADTLFRLTTYSNAPSVMSALTACRQLSLALRKNVTYLSFERLVDGLHREAEATGRVTVKRSVAAREVGDDGTVRFDHAEVRARHVVLAVPLEAAAKLRPHDAALQAFRAASVPARAACLDVVLRRLPDPRRRLALGLGEALYASVHRQERESTVVQVAKYLAPGEAGAAAGERLEHFFEAFQPGWRDELVEKRFMPELRVTDVPLAVRSGRGFGVEVAPRVSAAADWALGGLLADGGLTAARAVVLRCTTETERRGSAASPLSATALRSTVEARSA